MSPRTASRHREHKGGRKGHNPPQETDRQPKPQKISTKEFSNIPSLFLPEENSRLQPTLSELKKNEGLPFYSKLHKCSSCEKSMFGNEVYGSYNYGADVVCSKDCDAAYKNKRK